MSKMSDKFLVVNWSDQTTTVTRSRKVVCGSLAANEKVQMQVKDELWTGVIDSVWGK